jgi:hypothetical protein
VRSRFDTTFHLAGCEAAVVDGVATITRGAWTVLVRHPFTHVLALSGDGWRIAHIRAYTLMDK